MKTPILMALMSATAIVLPSYALAQAQNDCDRLMVLVEQDRGAAAGIVPLDEARRLQAERNQEACLVAIQQIEGAAGQQPAGSDIVVRQPAPTVTVDQAAPQVSVQQPQPNVLVRQPQPEILVRQPAPRVTIDIPQPEIIVRMPQPEVAVQQAQPQVQVEQARPEVSVVQPEQPQVQVEEAAQANVQLVRPEGQPEVTVERIGEPSVRYERAEANVMVNQPVGEPQIRVEQLGGQAAQAEQQAAAMDQPAQTGALLADGGAQRITAADLEGMQVFNASGEQIGEVENIVRSTVDNREYAVISHGGLFGLGEKRVVLLVSALALRDDAIILPNATDEQIRSYPAMEAYDQRFPELEDTAQVEITTAQR